ncbi:hypothetical protein [Aureivirga sp. CE67]|uniref:DUF7336 domain-containing protein n=1 Tax=Aureivirga sp. CE67 TaxID=1788983 RepID=UPI0018C92DAB|nr:hypothetical protein [Aureivirga sp. CE67]
MEYVYILHHTYELGNIEKSKLIGIYSSEQEAKNAIERLRDKNGFKNKVEGFNIEKYKINEDHWKEGFSTITSINVKDIHGNWKTVEAEELTNGKFKIIEKYENYLLGEFKDGFVVNCIEKSGELFAIYSENE